jgi:uncharacterized protein (TIGR03000 family)
MLKRYLPLTAALAFAFAGLLPAPGSALAAPKGHGGHVPAAHATHSFHSGHAPAPHAGHVSAGQFARSFRGGHVTPGHYGRAYGGRGWAHTYAGRDWNHGAWDRGRSYGRYYGWYGRPGGRYGWYGRYGYPWRGDWDDYAWGGYPGYYGGYYPSYAAYYDSYSPSYYDDYPAYSDDHDYAPYYDDSYYPDTSDYYSTPVPDEDYSYAQDDRAPVTPPARNTALITVHVPDPDAVLWFNGVQTTQRGTERLFESPGLEPGRAFAYTIRAHWMANGQEVEQSRRIEVHAGDRLTAEFPVPRSAIGSTPVTPEP